jgi:hypothetical protein
MHETIVTERASDLHRCLNCGSELVQPVEWEPAGRAAWSVLMRCPDCDIYRAGVFEQPTLDAYDQELDRGEAILRDAYLGQVRDNMRDEIDRFSAALAAGAILPEDF